jgi:hypothetical protein
MDFVELEKQFTQLSRDCFLKLSEAESRLRKAIDEKFQELEANLEKEALVLENFEQEIGKEMASFRTALAEIKAEIQALKTTEEGIYLDELEAQLTREAETKLQPFLSEQKKKKADLGQKISVLKRELANFHKENNMRLIEEEKHFKNREAELLRRLNIDLERKNEANIKAYSEYEKRLLLTDEEEEIAELKEKIKEIRIAGIRELKKIKEQYAFLQFENRLEFRKFSERIILENSLKAEETKFRVRALEAERRKTDLETESERQKAAFEIQKILLERERDAEMDKNKRLLENELAILELERKAAETEALSEQKRNSLGAEYRKEAAKYDQAKTAVRATLGDALSANAKETADLLVNHLQAYVKLFKKIMLSLLQEIEEESRAAHGRFQEYLWIARRGLPEEPAPKHVLNEFARLAEENFRARKQIYEDASAFLGREIAEIIFRIRNINAGLSVRRAQLKEREKNLFLGLRSLLEKGYREIEAKKSKQASVRSEFKQKQFLLQKEAARRNAEITDEYNRKLARLKTENAAFFEALKKEERGSIRDDRVFAKKSKKRQRELKRNFSVLIAQYEKELLAAYKNELKKNMNEEREIIKQL